MGELAIAVTGLRKSFGPKEAVAGIDLEIAAGSLAGLVGPNGAGKTTSLSMMTGLLRPDGGRVLINGLDMWADPPAAKAVIGVVPAEARLFERLSGEELLEYAGRLRGMPAAEARSRAKQLLDVLDLAEDAKRLVADFSTGMRKKAMLGCALIHNPSVLFLDEPLEGVDPISADVIRRLLASGAAGGASVGAFHSNAIGWSGPGFSLEAMALNGRRALRAYFSGQNIALGTIAVPLVTAVCFGLAAVAKHPMDGFAAMAVGLAAIGAGMALANLFTVAMPYPVEKRGGTPMPRATSGHNGEAAGSQLITLLGVGLAVTPVILAAVFTQSVPTAVRMPVLVLGAAAYGLALAWGGVRAAANLAEPKLPELSQIAIQTNL
jgi:ABC-2 type transport system ATP-binding protein